MVNSVVKRGRNGKAEPTMADGMAACATHWEEARRVASGWEEQGRWEEGHMEVMRSVERIVRRIEEGNDGWKRDKGMHLCIERAQNMLRKVKRDAETEEKWMVDVKRTLESLQTVLERPEVPPFYLLGRRKGHDGTEPTHWKGKADSPPPKMALPKTFRKKQRQVEAEERLERSRAEANNNTFMQDMEQEEIKDELLDLVQGLKNNALLAGQSLENRRGTLDDYETNVNRSLAGAKYGNEKQDMLLKRGRGSLCLKLAMIGAVCIVFVFTYMVIKVTKVRG